MRCWRPFGIAIATGVAASLIIAALAPFLAPNLTYEVIDGAKEWLSGNRQRTYRIALGARTGSYAYLGATLNAHLKARAGYELEPVYTGGVPENVAAILDPTRQIQLAIVEHRDAAIDPRGLLARAAIPRAGVGCRASAGQPALARSIVAIGRRLGEPEAAVDPPSGAFFTCVASGFSRTKGRSA